MELSRGRAKSAAASAGHMHANRVLIHETFTEYNTQPLVMGGIDMTPGGYRVFRQTESGALEVRHRNIVNDDVAVLLAPADGLAMPPCKAQIIAAVETAVETTQVTATVEGLGEVPLTARGGWTWASETLSLCEPGSHAVTVSIADVNGSTRDLGAILEIAEPAAIAAPPDWSLFQGGADHRGRAEWTGAFPAVTRWLSEVGGAIHGGSPIVFDGRLFVSVSDFGDGLAGGVVAFDARSGERLWQHRVGFSVPHAPAAASGKVFFLSNDGVLHCVDAATGASHWTYELAPGWPPVQRNLYSSPTVSGGKVYAGGRHEFAALDIETGDVAWSLEPFTEFGDLASHASPAVSAGVVVMPFNRKGGLYAYDAELGTELWHTSWQTTIGIQGSPVIVEETVFVINELMQWSYRGDDALIRATHYHGRSPAFSAAPTSVAGQVWIPGADGTIRVLDSRTGAELWRRDLGVPMTASLVLSGGLAYVASFDGTVRALSAAP